MAGRDRLASSHSRIFCLTAPAASPASAEKLVRGAPSCSTCHTGPGPGAASAPSFRTASYSSPCHHTVTRFAIVLLLVGVRQVPYRVVTYADSGSDEGHVYAPCPVMASPTINECMSDRK